MRRRIFNARYIAAGKKSGGERCGTPFSNPKRNKLGNDRSPEGGGGLKKTRTRGNTLFPNICVLPRKGGNGGGGEMKETGGCSS